MIGSDPGSSQGPQFKLTLLAFLALGAIGLGILIWLAIDDPDRRDSLGEAADWIMKTGIGAAIGMLVDRRVR
jgi:hypothetical protein